MFYTVVEVSKIINVSPYTISYWLRENQLPAVKIGRQWRITEETLAGLKKGEYPKVLTKEEKGG